MQQSLIAGTIPVDIIFTESEKTFKVTSRFKAALDADRFSELEKNQIKVLLTL